MSNTDYAPAADVREVEIQNRLVISRHSRRPGIRVSLHRDVPQPKGGADRITLDISLEDYVDMVVDALNWKAIGPIERATLTAGKLHGRIRAAAQTALEQVKEASTGGLT